MTRNDIQLTLAVAYPNELIESLLTSYENALVEYKKGHWQYFGNEVGQFIEVARRIIEYQLNGTYTSLTDKLSIFNEKLLMDFERKGSEISEVYRIVIPRILYAMYCLRNKRGMIHKSHIDPNKMDATVLLGNTKWVLAELFRIVSTLSFDETEKIVDSIMCRETSIIWDTGTTLRVLNAKMSARDKILCLLYTKNNQSENDLRNSIEYKNVSEFRKILKALHKEKMIEYTVEKCSISPVGIKKAESLLANYVR